MITEMKVEHLAQVVALERDLFSSPWDESAFRYELNDNPFSYNWVIEQDGKILGFCGLWCLFDQAQVTNLAVAKSHQRQHLGQQLMAFMEEFAMIQGCEVLSLEVRVSNTPAINLYKKCGLEKVSIRKDYYQDNHEDAWLMMKAIGGRI